VGPAIDAVLEAGFRSVELTLTTPGALARIAELSTRKGLLVGAGTVLTVEQAREAVARGARFLVSPVFDAAVVAEATALGVAAMPGAHTPTELFAAHRAGAPLQKLFPAPGIGPDFIAACLGPMPFLRIVPTHGVTAENAAAWLSAGAHSLGCVRPLFDPDELAAGRFDLVHERARRILRAVGRG
jgi:2-dehydro-3-deoxyphosphogluconate aldolase/(4S)-4-hydroxy-2-oxoglutarate aldolase